ncbi:hypothetical protein [Maribacter aestuarii]|nr:hypothetical protein [Maribacter aestuarii]
MEEKYLTPVLMASSSAAKLEVCGIPIIPFSELDTDLTNERRKAILHQV